MASKTFTAYHKNTSNKYGIQVVCTSVPDVATNTSTLTAKFYIIHPTIDISSRTGKLGIDGKTYSFTVKSVNKSGPTLLYTKTVPIVHDNDGTRDVKITASFPFDMTSNSYGRLGTVSGSGTMTLDNIPRTSKISSQVTSMDVTGTSEWRVGMTKYADAFRHKAVLTFGDSTIDTGVFDTETAVVIPVEWLNLIPTQKESTVDVSIQTYSDESCTTAVGDPITTSFVIRVPSNAAPVLKSGWATVAPYNAGTAADGMDVYVQGYSQAYVTFNPSLVVLKYGANNAIYQVTYAGSTSADFTPVLAVSGKQTVKCTVTDSRGNQAVEDMEIDVQPYSPPTLTNISLYRCNTAGVEQEDGTMLYFKTTCNYSDCAGENSVRIIAEWKNASASHWGNATALENGVGSVLGAGAVSDTSSYNARITATDRLGNQVSFTTLISTAQASFNLLDGGKGGAFGKYAEKENLLDSVWRIRAADGFDPVILDWRADLNDVMIQNVYAGEDVTSGEYANCPVQSGTFTLEVLPAGNGGQFVQRLTTCHKTEPVTYERYYQQGSWGAWFERLRMTGTDILPMANGGTGANTGADAMANFGVADYIVEQGTTNGWLWRKWAGGIAECWGKLTKTDAFSHAWGSLYETYPFDAVNYPFAFAEPPYEFATPGDNAIGAWVERNSSATQSTTRSGTYQLIRPAKDTTQQTLKVNIYVVGKWK